LSADLHGDLASVAILDGPEQMPIRSLFAGNLLEVRHRCCVDDEQ